MNLVASVMVGTGERDRYLPIVIPALFEFCDVVVVLDESVDGSGDLCRDLGAIVERTEPGAFFAHEGRARQLLLDVTLEQQPTHVLSIDADELIADGAVLRAACESDCPVLTVVMQEIWRVDESGLAVRMDGGWREHTIPILYRAPTTLDGTWRIQDKALACGREPGQVRNLFRQRCSEWSGTEVLHLGWANEAERQDRYQRYVVADGGRFHAGSHLQSIMWPDRMVNTKERDWPETWPKRMRAELLKRAAR